MPYDVFAQELTNMFQGVPLIFADEFPLESDKVKGMRIATVHVKRELCGIDDSGKPNYMTKTFNGRSNPNPMLNVGISRVERYSVQVYLKIRAGKKLEAVATTDYKAQDHRANGITDACGSYIVGQNQEKTKFYLLYVVKSYLSDRTITDENGQVLTDEQVDDLQQYLQSGYRQSTKEASARAQADKMGIAVEELPQVRTMKLENIESIELFGRTLRPIKG